MKLHNKRTGDVVEIYKIGLVWNKYGMPADIGQYNSLAELNEEWEDYTPDKPLIEDEAKRSRMRKYKGLFTFDVENHRYLPVEQADGVVVKMNYRPEQGEAVMKEMCEEDEE